MAKVGADDVFDDALFGKAQEGAEKFLSVIKDMEAALKQDAIAAREYLSSFNLTSKTSAQDIDKLNTSLNNSGKVLQDATKAEQSRLKVAQEMEKLNQQQLKTAKLREDSIKREQQNADKLTKATQKQNSAYAQLNEQYKKAAANAKNLAAEFGVNSKEAEGAAIQAKMFHDQLLAIDQTVGQSQRNVGNYEGSLNRLGKGLRGLGGLGKILSDALGIPPEIADGIREAGRAIKDITHAEELETVATGEHTVAVETEIVVEKESNALKNISLGLWGLLATAVVAGAYAIWQYVSAKKAEEEIDVINLKTSEIIRGVQEDINNELREQTKLIIKLRVQKGLMSKEDGDIALIEEDRVQKRLEAMKKMRGEMVELRKAAGLDNKRLDDEGNAITDRLISGNNNSHIGKKGYILQSEKDIEKAKAFNADKLKIEEKYRQELLAIDKTFSLEEEVKVGEDKSKEKKKTYDDLEFQLLQSSLRLQKLQTDNAKKQLDIQRQIDLNELSQQDIDLKLKAAKALEIEQKYQDDLAKLTEGANGKMIKVKELKGKEDDEDYKKRKEQREKENEERKQEIEDLLKFTEDALKRKDALTEKNLNNDLEMRQRNIMQQQQLAEAGRANTLAFEKAAAAKDELAKQQNAAKIEKREKALAFLKLFASYAEKGDPDQALSKTIVQMAIAGAIAGSYFEGTENVGEDLKGNKVHNGRDGYRIAVDGSERIMTGDQNKKVGDLSNEELAAIAYRYNNGDLIPKYMTAGGPSFGNNISDSILLHQFANLTSEVKGLREVIEGRPIPGLNIDKEGIITKTQFKNGILRVMKSKPNNNNFV